ncbi:MAG: sigma 54-interacting transcriptional regulator, partial [Bacillota bacterium]|nr:sigma 54-interacting transcriptional regulator [Bacillota bacterium]
VERSDPNYNLTYVNKALADYYGYTQEELIGTDTMELVAREDRATIYQMMKSVDAEHPHYRYQYRVKNKNGETAWMESVGRGFYDENGVIIEYQDIGRDITHFKDMEHLLTHEVEQRTKELKSANTELIRLNRYLQSILSGISEGIIVIDKTGNCEFLNYGPDGLWREAEKEIGQYFQGLLNGRKSNALNWLFLKKRPFADLEMHGKSLSFIVSGMPLEIEEDMVSKCILVLKPVTQVHKMVNRLSGAQARFQFKDIITVSPSLQEAIFLGKQAASSDCNILIEGESGTGKEMFAQSIHNRSHRKKGPFVAVNCGAIPRELVASELFGYMEGSFTGAKKGGKPGKFELAEGGTLFLDEIGDMPMEQQIALLRVIQERRVTRVGGEREIPVDVRIICATNKNLLNEVVEKNFREDLYYRLNVINLHIPPLRERKDDILPLFCSFWAKASPAENFLERLQPDAMAALLQYDWPGNVRELQNVAERILFFSGGKDIMAQYLPPYILEAVTASPKELQGAQGAIAEKITATSIREVRERKKDSAQARERQRLLAALNAANGNVSAAARALGVSRATFYRKLSLGEE